MAKNENTFHYVKKECPLVVSYGTKRYNIEERKLQIWFHIG